MNRNLLPAENVRLPRFTVGDGVAEPASRLKLTFNDVGPVKPEEILPEKSRRRLPRSSAPVNVQPLKGERATFFERNEKKFYFFAVLVTVSAMIWVMGNL